MQDTIKTIRDNLLSEWAQIIPNNAFSSASEEEKQKGFRDSFEVLADTCMKAYFNSLIEHGKIVPNWGESINLVSSSWFWGTTDDDVKLMLAATNFVVSSSSLFDNKVCYKIDGKLFEIYRLHGVLYAEEV
ncbi:hypothetical protein LCGC14_2212910 [marine sediment metagenome]|uniref:Uncharacterized protein n=1 Tax=marine sediment metagenome TaxID=412755 RepID=A0A0F9FQS5_9ZZZZ